MQRKASEKATRELKDRQRAKLRGALLDAPWAILPRAFGELLQLSLGVLPVQELSFSAAYHDDDEETDDPPYTVKDGVAVIRITGALRPRSDWLSRYYGWSTYQDLQGYAEDARSNGQVREVRLSIDSPGGAVLGLAETAEQFRSLAAVKPVIAHTSGMIASAAYWLASTAHEIYATSDAIVGSIGCLDVHMEYARALEEHGYGVTVIRNESSPLKASNSPYERLSEAGRKELTRMCNEYATKFEQFIAEERDVSLEEVRARFGGGAVFIGEDAARRGLIDGVKTWSQVLGVLGGSSSQRVAATNAVIAHGVMTVKYTPRMKAALFLRGLIAAVDSPDAECDTAVKAFCNALGKSEPQNETDFVALFSAAAPAAQVLTTELRVWPEQVAPAVSAAPAANASQTQPAASRQADEDKHKLKAGGARVLEIQARAKALGMAHDAPLVMEACDSDMSVEAATDHFVQKMAEHNKPVRTTVEVQDKAAPFAAAVVGALFNRSMDALAKNNKKALQLKQAKPEAGWMGAENISFSRLAEQCLHDAGARTRGLERSQVAEYALDWGKGRLVDELHSIGFSASGGTFNSPASFPNILSALSGKIAEASQQMAKVTYREWAHKLDDVTDFKPRPVVAIGAVGELPDLGDKGEFEDITRAEETSFLTVQRKGAGWSMTPKMVADDDLGLFADHIAAVIDASERTVNRMCLELLITNPKLLDDTELFHASRGNIVTGSGVTEDALSAMQLALRTMKGIGGVGYLNMNLSRVLVAPQKEKDVRKILSAIQMYPQTSGNVNIFQAGDLNTEFSIDGMINEYSPTGLPWWGFGDGAYARTVVYAYQTGYSSLVTRQWYDERVGHRKWSHELRVGAAPRNPRGAIYNPGA